MTQEAPEHDHMERETERQSVLTKNINTDNSDNKQEADL